MHESDDPLERLRARLDRYPLVPRRCTPLDPDEELEALSDELAWLREETERVGEQVTKRMTMDMLAKLLEPVEPDEATWN